MSKITEAADLTVERLEKILAAVESSDDGCVYMPLGYGDDFIELKLGELHQLVMMSLGRQSRPYE